MRIQFFNGSGYGQPKRPDSTGYGYATLVLKPVTDASELDYKYVESDFGADGLNSLMSRLYFEELEIQIL